MKTFLTVIFTALLTWCTFSVVQAGGRGVQKLWMVSAIKVPGKMAIADIQKEMNEGRYDVAKVKLKVFMETWERFDKGPDSCSGYGIGDVMVGIGKVDVGSTANVPEPSSAANGSLPVSH
jgi:hypothetical protein